MVEPVGSQFLACWLWLRRKRMNLMPTVPSLNAQSASRQSPVLNVLLVVFQLFLTTSNHPKIIYPRLVHLRGVTIATIVCLSVEFYGVHRNITFSILYYYYQGSDNSGLRSGERKRKKQRTHNIISDLDVFVETSYPLLFKFICLDRTRRQGRKVVFGLSLGHSGSIATGQSEEKDSRLEREEEKTGRQQVTAYMMSYLE